MGMGVKKIAPLTWGVKNLFCQGLTTWWSFRIGLGFFGSGLFYRFFGDWPFSRWILIVGFFVGSGLSVGFSVGLGSLSLLIQRCKNWWALGNLFDRGGE